MTWTDYDSLYNERANNLQHQIYTQIYNYPSNFNPFANYCSISYSDNG